MTERPNTVSGLVAKRREIAREIERLQAELRQRVTELDHVEATIHLFDPNMELEEINARPVPQRHRAFRGEVTRIVLSALRNASRPLATWEITRHLMGERGLDTANKGLVRVMNKRVGACLRDQRKKGRVVSERTEGQGLVWRLGP